MQSGDRAIYVRTWIDIANKIMGKRIPLKPGRKNWMESGLVRKTFSTLVSGLCPFLLNKSPISWFASVSCGYPARQV